MKKQRVGVIGVGAMGKHHTRLYSELESVELVGVADVNDRAAAEVAAEYNTAVFTDGESLLKSDLDAVSIAYPQACIKKSHLKLQIKVCTCLLRSLSRILRVALKR